MMICESGDEQQKKATLYLLGECGKTLNEINAAQERARNEI